MKKKIENYLKNNRWYHGTTLNGWNKICELGVKSNYNIGNELDFGYGFYLTPQSQQAEEYIKNLLKYSINFDFDIPMKNYHDKKIPIVIEFEICPWGLYELNTYNFKILNAYDDDFANFVFHNRVNNINGECHHNFDIIFGVMSDSVPTILIQKYKNKEKTKQEVIEELKKSTRNKQLSLHTQEVCDIIKPTRAYYVNTGEELNVNDYRNK